MRMSLEDYYARAKMAQQLCDLSADALADPLERMAAYKGLPFCEDILSALDREAAHVETLRRQHAVGAMT